MDVSAEINKDGFFDSLIASYETRIQKIQTAFQSSENITESSYYLFNNVHNTLDELKKEREVLNSRLCETLAKNGSLRKKDYNTLMSGILGSLEEKEKDAENQFLIFIESQKETVRMLKNSILEIKDITSNNPDEKISTIRDQMAGILKLQEMRKKTVMDAFLEFQQMHTRIQECLENLLKNGDNILIKDIKKIRDQIVIKKA